MSKARQAIHTSLLHTNPFRDPAGVWENGRRYQNFREGLYWFPNDEVSLFDVTDLLI
jgi:hypothetical protein